MRHSLGQHFPFLAGFFLVVNLFVVPPVDASPRLTDLLGIALGLRVLYRLATGRQPVLPLAFAFFALAFPLAWIVPAFFMEDPATIVQSGRWLLAIPWALTLLEILRREDHTIGLAWGLVIGCGVNVGVIMLQAVGLEGYLRWVGLSSDSAIYYYTTGLALRLPGLHGHHGASSAVMSLIIPAVMYLYLKGRAGALWVLVSLGALMIGLHLASTRSPLVITAATLLFAMLTARRLDRILAALGVVLVLVVPVLVMVGPPGGWSRWTDQQAISTNAQERFDSNLGSAYLTVTVPWGHGVKNGAMQLADRTTQSATHNAFLQAGLVYGLPFALLVILGVGRAVSRARHGPAHPGLLPALLAFHFGGLAMFEEHLNNPTFIILVAWFVTALIWAPRPAAEGPPPAGALPAGQTD
ncbi:MAG: hypothetical protein ABIK96_04615 [bacterium]